MSLITDLLSKVTQTRPRKDVPPGLTNSINSYKRKETNRRKAIFFSVVIIASLASGFAAIYAASLLLGGGAVPVRTEMATSAPVPSPTPLPATVPEQTKAPAETPEAKKAAAAPKQTAPTGTAARKAAKKTRPAAAAIKSDPAKTESAESPDALRHYYAALDFEREGEYIKAIDEYTAALTIEPGNFRLMNKVGSLYMRMGMWEEASRHIDASVTENGQYVPALINRGIVYAQMKRFEEAEASLKEALRLKPASRLALFNIALLYEKSAMPEKARAHYMKLKRLGDPQGAEGLRRLGSAPGATAGIAPE